MAELKITPMRSMVGPAWSFTKSLGPKPPKTEAVFTGTCCKCVKQFRHGDKVTVTDGAIVHKRCPDAPDAA